MNGLALYAFMRLIERCSIFYRQLTLTLAMSSTLLPRCSRGDMSRNEMSASGEGLDRAELVLLPLNLPRLGPYGHWALLFASMNDSTVTAYDPPGCSRDEDVSACDAFLTTCSGVNAWSRIPPS